MEVGRRALDLSMRAIDAYRKTLLVDKVTSDDEMPAPASILDEICNILMSCPLDLTKELVEYTFRRLRHRSSRVKTKVLQFIKYSVNKAGSCAYRKELQMHSITIRELFNHQEDGHPLEGTALSQTVRVAAQEAIKAIFISENSALQKSIQIEGFGSGNFSNMLAPSCKSSGGGSFYSGNDSENIGYSDNCGSLEHHNSNDCFEYMQDGQKFVEREGFHQLDASLIFVSPNSKEEKKGMTSSDELSMQSHERKLFTGSMKVVTPEEKLLNDITAPTGLRLRPSDASLQSFLSRAKAHDASRIAGALKTKLGSSSWKVRLRAVSVLRAILWQQDGSLSQEVMTDEREFHAFVRECLNFPQATLKREAQEALERLSAMKEVKMHRGAINDRMDNPCIQAVLENSPTVEKNGLSKSPSAFEPQNELVNLLSTELEELTCDPGVKKTINSAPENPVDIDRVCVHGSNDEPLIHTKDLLSEPWVSMHSPMPSETMHHVENTVQSPIMVQFSTGQQSKQEINLQGLESVTNFAGNITSSGIYSPKFLDREKIQSLSNRNMSGAHNLDALFMHPKGMGSLHTNNSGSSV